MRAKPRTPRVLQPAFLLAVLCILTFAQEPVPVLTQAAEIAVESAEEVSSTETPGSLPHLRFLWDYLLVAALLAGAMYAVCRSSRRI